MTNADPFIHAPCRRDPDQWIYPDNARVDRTQEHARTMCAPCPVIAECARYTLQRALPVDCIQAGKSWGSGETTRARTARALAAQYGLPEPDMTVTNRGGTQTHNGTCIECGRPMESRRTASRTPGTLLYGGRGKCSSCFRRHTKRTRREREKSNA